MLILFNMNHPNLILEKIINMPGTAILATLGLIFTGFSPVTAENIISGGTTLKVLPGTTVVSSENLVVENGATLDNAGTLILKKDFTNENVSANLIGSGTAEFSGIVRQTISGKNILNSFVVDNSAGVAIGGNTTVTDLLNLANGRVILGDNNLLLGVSATIAGSLSAAKMIIVTGTGELRKEFPAAVSGSFTYPVGDDAGTADYSPVTLLFSGGMFAGGNYIGVSLKNEPFPDPDITGNYLNRYWTLTQSGITNFTCNAVFTYVSTDVTGTENLISCTKVSPVPWVTYGLTNSSLHQLTATGISAFSSFTGVKSTTPPANQELVNIFIANGITNCYDATQVLTVAGNGATFLVENGGNVTLVAGNKIIMLAGTKVNFGGILHGYITTTNNYCGSSFNPLVANLLNEQTLGGETLGKNQFIKVYPNPTTDLVIVELIESGTNSTANVTVYGMQGGKLLQKNINGGNQYRFSLLGKPAGIYMVHVQSGDRSEVAKVIKTN